MSSSVFSGKPKAARDSNAAIRMRDQTTGSDRQVNSRLNNRSMTSTPSISRPSDDQETSLYGAMSDAAISRSSCPARSNTGPSSWLLKNKRLACQSVQKRFPLLPRERVARCTGIEWEIFARHENYVRPTRDRDWVSGEPCCIRRNGFELPPGSEPYYHNSMGFPATAWEPFVFPNPPRPFLMSLPSRHPISTESLAMMAATGVLPPPGGSGKFAASGGYGRGTRQRGELELDDLERQLWFDPEPRLERPFRVYADTRYCVKGGNSMDCRNIVRTGW